MRDLNYTQNTFRNTPANQVMINSYLLLWQQKACMKLVPMQAQYGWLHLVECGQ